MQSLWPIKFKRCCIFVSPHGDPALLANLSARGRPCANMARALDALATAVDRFLFGRTIDRYAPRSLPHRRLVTDAVQLSFTRAQFKLALITFTLLSSPRDQHWAGTSTLTLLGKRSISRFRRRILQLCDRSKTCRSLRCLGWSCGPIRPGPRINQ